jgi:phosphoserine aminotransferase
MNSQCIGPAPLATSVLQAAAQAMLNYKDSGLSICEISHRSSLAADLLQDTKAALKELMEIPDTHEVHISF